ncbi:MAG: YciI family protein [Chthoniobacteraceae bacterium]|jgi:hypothetical protein
MSTKDEYILLFRGDDWHKGLSAEETQQAATRMMDWFKKLTFDGTVLGGNPLDREGKIVSGKGGRIVSDGPFAESKEAVGGYFLVRATSLDEAVAIAQDCPILAYGAQVEVRHIAETCPLAGAAPAEAELAGATA